MSKKINDMARILEDLETNINALELISINMVRSANDPAKIRTLAKQIREIISKKETK